MGPQDESSFVAYSNGLNHSQHVGCASRLLICITVFNLSGRGSSALSPDGRNLMVYNFSDELHLYAVGTRGLQQPRRRYKFDAAPKSKHALQMAFLHQGRAVVCGTTTGNACIWETTLGEFFQLLPHDRTLGTLRYISRAHGLSR